MKRSAHVAVRVLPAQLEAAVAFYKSTLGLTEGSQTKEGVELTGPNLFLYIEPDPNPIVLQEFIAETPDVRKRFEDAGCRIFKESEFGFHVTDPFGMSYHIWSAKEKIPPAN